MTVFDLIEEFDKFERHSSGRPSGVVLSPRDIEAVQADLMASSQAKGVYSTDAVCKRLPKPNTPGDVYTMTIHGVPVFQRATLCDGDIEMWRDR